MEISRKCTAVYLTGAFVFAFALLPVAVEATDCGDFTNDGTVNAADVVAMLDYLMGDGPAPADFDLAEFDGHQLLTFNDAAVLMATFGSCDVLSDPCPATLPPFEPGQDTNNDHLVWVRSGEIRQNQTELTALVSVNSPWPYMGFTVPLKFRVDGQVPVVDSIQFPLEGSSFYGSTGFTRDRIIADSGIVVLGGLNFSTVTGEEYLAEIYLSFPPAGQTQNLEAELVRVIPEQAPTQDSTVFPLISYYCEGGITPTLDFSCCTLPGDVNLDGSYNISDAVYLIRRIFGGGPEVPCCDAADTDGNGAAHVADAVYIINNIFKGGPSVVCGTAGNQPCL